MARSGNKSAFTLLEVLVATAILVVIVAVLASLVGAGQNSLIRIDSGARQRQEAMAVLDMISSELRSSIAATVHLDEFAHSGTRRAELLINPPLLGSALLNPGAIFWQSFSMVGDGTPSIVGYFLRWDTAQAGAPRPLLCRFQLESARAGLELERLRDGTQDRTWVEDAVAGRIAPGTAANGFQGWLADHVIGFFVRALDPTGKTVAFQARQVISNANGRNHRFNNTEMNHGTATSNFTVYHESNSLAAPAPVNPAGTFDSLDGYAWDTGTALQFQPSTLFKHRYGPALPPMVEIAIVVVPPAALRRLTAVPTYPAASADFWADIDAFVAALPPEIAASARVYSTTVSLPPSSR